MTTFNYEQSIWGKGDATLSLKDPTSFRLHQALKALTTIPEGGRVLEIGCGAGQFIRAVKKHRPDLQCLGCDISEEGLRLAQKYNDGVSYSLNIEEAVPYEDDSIDAVLIFDVLEHVQNPQALVKEVYRILKKGGLFYSFVPCEGDIFALWNLLEKLHLKKELTKKYAGHINYFSRKDLKNLFKDNQFIIESIRYSEHVVGQIVGVFAYILMNRAAHQKGILQINNETYFGELKKNEQKFRLGKLFRNCVNGLMYIESSILTRIPSPNVHTIVRK